MVADIRSDDKIKLWFSNREYAEKTRETYAVYMQLFCECINKTPSEVILEANIETRNGLLLNERKAVEYFAKFKDCLKNKGFSDKTQGLAISAVTSFYQFYDIQLSGIIGRNKKRLPQKENEVFLTRDDVKKILANANSLRDRAIILCMATGGFARAEILTMKTKYITFDDSGVGVISIRRDKVHFDYTTFISPEAVEALKAYFEERNRTPELKIKGPNDYVFVIYQSGYRFKAGSKISDREFTKIFRTLGEKLGYKNDAGWINSRSQALRKYFGTTLENAGVPKFKVDFMMGHVPDGVDRAYFNQDVDKLKELYIHNAKYLAINRELVVRSKETVDTRKVAQLEADKEMIELKLLEREREIQDLQKQVADRDTKLDTMSKQFESRFAHMDELERKLSPFIKNLAADEKAMADIEKETDLSFLKKGADKKAKK